MKNNITTAIVPVAGAVGGISAALYACVYVAWASLALTNGVPSGYNWVNATISELGVPGTPLAAPTAVMFIVTGALQLVFALGLYLSLTRVSGSAKAPAGSFRLPALLGSLMIAAEGFFDSIGSGVFPAEPGGASQTAVGMIHFAVSVIGLAATVAAPFFLARAFRDHLKAIMLARVSFAAGLLFSVLFVIGVIMAILELPGVGFAQRILYYTYFVWIFILAIWILCRSYANRRN